MTQKATNAFVDRHIDRQYDNELQTLRQQLLAMAKRTEQMVAYSIQALVDRDQELAHKTISMDHQVNRDEVALDQQCLNILARRQPMASDLRSIALTLKIVTDLERVGDLAVCICRRVIVLQDMPASQPHMDDILGMAHVVQSMIHGAIDAFTAEDVEKARQVIERDDKVDAQQHQIFHNLLTLMVKDPSHIEWGIHAQSIVNRLERLADHCTNLAEQVVFLVQGEDIRHHQDLLEHSSH